MKRQEFLRWAGRGLAAFVALPLSRRGSKALDIEDLEGLVNDEFSDLPDLIKSIRNVAGHYAKGLPPK